MRAALFAALVVAACGDEEEIAAPAVERVPHDGIAIASPGERGELCADVVDARVCWGGEGDGCTEGVCGIDRVLPDLATPGAWRCRGAGEERRCVVRRRGAGAFACTDTTCTQAQPRLPDASFWECIDDEGIVVCRGGEPASGVFPADPDPGWTCGERRGEPQRICVDLSPDLPNDDARGWRCHFEHSAGEKRLCVRDEAAPAVAAPCTETSACTRGTVCAGGRCLPLRIDPACWLDRDCGDGRWCRFGACLEGTR